MQKFRILIGVCLLLVFQQFSFGQSTSEQLLKEWERAKAYTKEYLDAMPEAGYSFRPTSDMRSFAEQMLHLSDANFGFGSAAVGVKSPYEMGQLEKATTDKSKANVTKLVMAGYDFILDGIKKLSPAQLDEKIKLFGKFEMTRAMVLAKDFEHQTHHRAQTTVYLRLEKITPPAEKLF